MNKQGVLTIVSGFSGTGKGTLMKLLLDKYKNDYCLSISATTRQPRTGEIDGKDYFFVSRAEFERMISAGELLEYAQYLDNYYGTPRKFAVDKMNSGVNVLLEIEMQGALKIKAQYPDTLLLFIVPPAISSLEQRLRTRGTETEDVIQSRLQRACDEMEFVKDYDYIIINDDLDECAGRIHQIIENEQFSVARNKALLEKMQMELLAYKKGE